MIAARPAIRDYGNIKVIRGLIWIYFFFLIFEGMLRMLLPSLSNVLLVVRDPFLLGAYFVAHISKIFPWNRYVVMLWLLGAVLVVFGLGMMPNAPMVVAFGFRVAFLHVPLIFLIPNVMDELDVLAFGKWFLILSIPMAFLMAAQFQAGPDSWLNRGVDMQFKQIDAGGGKIRPPGTFTFTLGTGYFYATTVAFLLYDQFHRGYFAKWLVTASAVATCVALGVSGSRSALAIVALVVVLAIIAVALAKPKAITGLVKFAFVVGVALLISSQISLFSEGTENLSGRIETASRTEGGFDGFLNRAFGEYINAFYTLGRAEVSGSGIGVGSNAGAAMLTGRAGFLLAEGEWDRMILEMGPIMGLIFLGMRVGLAGWMFFRSLQLAKEKSMLPILLFGVCGVLIVNGQWGQPTILGFAVFIGGLCLASGLKRPGKEQSAVVST